jgi:cysteine synthase A
VLSPVLSGGAPGPHPIQGIGAGFVPAILDIKLLDGIIQITKEEAFAYTARAAREEGIFMGVSSGGSLAAVAKKLPELAPNSRVLTFNYDTGERYLSVEGLFI